MSNMDLWNTVKQPPAKALKQIQAGRLKGKSDINPQWRMQAMTEMFGPCGKGWKYTIDRLWTEPGLQDQVFAFAQVSLYIPESVKDNALEKLGIEKFWSEPIPGIGGSMLLEKQSSGVHHNDEAFKMAVTDALSVAMKALGVAADIYLGLWDGSKYAKMDGLPKTTITPNDGAGEELSAAKCNELADRSIAIKDKFEVDDIQGAYDLYAELKDLEEKRYLWTLLASNVRSAIKKHGELIKEMKNGVSE